MSPPGELPPAAAEALRKLQQRMGGVFESTEDLTKAFVKLSAVYHNHEETIDVARRKMREINHTGMSTVQRMRDEAEGLERLDKVFGETLRNTDAFKRGIEEINKSIAREKSEALRGFASAFTGVSKTSQQMGASVGSLVGKHNTLKQAAERLAQSGGKFAAVGKAAGPLAPVIVALGVVLDALVSKISDAQDTAKVFGGTMFRSSVGVGTLTNIMIKNTALMALHNVKGEQLSGVYDTLNRSYGLSATQATKFSGSLNRYVDQITPAIIQTMAYGRVTGLTDEQTGKLISTFGVLGEDLRRSDELFAMVAVRAEEAGVNVSDMVGAITKLGSANIFTERSVGRTASTLSGYSRSIMTSNDALLTGANRAAVAANAMNSVAEASARMDLPTMLGFGAALDGITGNLDDAVRKVATMDRVDIFGRAMKEITARVEPGNQLIARTLMAQQFGISDVNSALGVAVGTLKDQKRNQAEALREQELIRRTGGDLTKLSAATANRLDDIHGILTKIAQAVALTPFGGLSGLINAFRGEGREGAAMPVARMTQPGMAMSAAGGSTQ